ncbi:MAG: helix-turn-helix transcriptional regulator [Nostoc sp. NMS7]|jgi:DNA-binding Xre family transcriptional regulator|uniref:helix-turn-helix domain-containing protein n=1 Tax=Nostoc TaxID=1177 RepID=UPI000E494992|nr:MULTISPECIES: helix-turn-helix transcriptional regulator [Nostoc]MBN3945039.1 helix-turn-helix transcriptional regulator [Nostoc sp. NMS7]MCC5634104.1 helix-turn-helix transcriptional regulator [Nostoc sphaeroides CHAB 2801]
MPVRNTIRRFIDEKLKITRYEFSERTGLSKTTVYNLYDNPEQIPNGLALNKICDCYKIQPCELLEWRED